MYYLYNGVRLPELPEYDKAVYPYAVLDKTNAGTSFLFYAFKSRPYYGTNPADSTKMGVYSSGGAKVYYFVPADGCIEWEHSMDTENPFAAEDGNENTLFWTNTDILYEGDGSVWLAASEPVGEGNWRKNFLMGLAMGLTGKPLFFKREPVAYLYNGVRLPPLKEIPEEYSNGIEFPYVYIFKAEGNNTLLGAAGFQLLYCNHPMIKRNYVEDGVRPDPELYPAYYTYEFLLSDDGNWEEERDGWQDNPMYYGGALAANANLWQLSAVSVVWSNTDILDESGELFFAATEPVPVYE